MAAAKPQGVAGGAPGGSSARMEEDARLAARAAKGDPRAFRALYERWRPAAFRLARGFAGLGPDEVEDVVQETFVRAFYHLGGLKDPARFGPWLLTIARNRAFTRLARHKVSSEVAEALRGEMEALSVELVDPPDPGRNAELEAVRRIILELPQGPERETVSLFYLEGKLSAREIADRLGVGKSAITMRLERFRARVKRRLAAEVARLRGEGS